MPEALTADLQRQLAEAVEDLRLAGDELTVAMHTLTAGDRADKKMIEKSLQLAFEKLAKARARLTALQS
jgi:hypothetical protein